MKGNLKYLTAHTALPHDTIEGEGLDYPPKFGEVLCTIQSRKLSLGDAPTPGLDSDRWLMEF